MDPLRRSTQAIASLLGTGQRFLAQLKHLTSTTERTKVLAWYKRAAMFEKAQAPLNALTDLFGDILIMIDQLNR
jgi:hypothetical protein